MDRRRKGHHFWLVFSIISLALACIAGVELAFCRVMDPVLFRTVTAPIVSAVQTAGRYAEQGVSTLTGTVKSWGEDIHAWQQARAARLAAEKAARIAAEEEARRLAEAAALDAQAASEPAICIETPVSDPAVTRFLALDGQEQLTGGNTIVYYNQADPLWAEQPYGPDHISGYGCGPTALSMVVSTMTETPVNPADMAAWCAEEGYCCPGSGSYLSIVPGVAEAYGLDCDSMAVDDADALVSALSFGGMAIALMGPGHFTSSGHFIVLHGATLSGKILVADPNSRTNSLIAWEPQTILEELSQSRDSGSPLWLLTAPYVL